MPYVPTVSSPGNYGAPDQEVTPLEAIQDEFDNDPEVGEALRYYVFSLEGGVVEEKAYLTLRERLFFLYLRSRRRAEDRQRDEHEECGVGA